MKRIVLESSILLILITSGCNNFSEPKISEEQAKSMVLKNHKKNIGNPKIISVNHKTHKYIVKWENKKAARTERTM